MTEVAAIDKPSDALVSQPYPPSWLDALTSWVVRSRGPTWLYYFGAAAALFLAQTSILWIEGAVPFGTVAPTHVFVAIAIPFVLALIHYLDCRAYEALVAARSILNLSEPEYLSVRYELTTLPMRTTLVASIVGAGFVVLISQVLGKPQSFQELAGKPFSSTLIYCMYVVIWWVFGAFLYHTVHQSRVIDRIYTEHTQIDLFRMKPLYGFSGVTAITAVSLAGFIYGWYVLNPGMLNDPTSLGIGLAITLLGVTTFIWPLLGVHRLLAEEKDQALGEAALRIEAAISELHQRVDSKHLAGMHDMHEMIASLEIEQNLLDRIPTWPWEPETVRLLITALALPLGLWLAQYILQRTIGP